MVEAAQRRAYSQLDCQIVRKMNYFITSRFLICALPFRPFLAEIRKDAVHKTGKGDIASLVDDIPFCPAQGAHVTPV